MRTTRWDAGRAKIMGQIKAIRTQVAIDITARTSGLNAGIKQVAALRASAKTPIAISFKVDRASATSAVNLFHQQLRAAKADAGKQIAIRVELRQWRQAMQIMAFDLYRIRQFARIPITTNTSSAHSNLNLLIQQLRVAQGLARLSVTAPGPGVAGLMGGAGGGRSGFLTGVGQGLGMPFTGSPEAMAGFLAAKATAAAIHTAAELQTTFADLRRIAGMTAVEMEHFKAKLFAIGTRQAGVSMADLTGIAETGARMGIADREGAEGLAKFTEQMAQVRNAVSGIGTEELADSMAQVLKVFGLSTDRVAGFGSALTALDNISTATASDILAITKGLSGTAASLRMTLPQVLSLSSVLKDVGLTNALAASSFSHIFRKMASDSDSFAKTIGVDAGKFKDAIRTDMMGALKMVMDAFSKLAGSDTIAAQELLADFGFTGVRTAGSFQQLSRSIDDVAKRTKIASEETGTLNALLLANEIKSQTAEAATIKFKNAMTQLGDVLGKQALPMLTDTTNAMTAMVKAMAEGQGLKFLGDALAIRPFDKDQANVDRKRALEDWIGQMLGFDMGGNSKATAPGQKPLPAAPGPLPPPASPLDMMPASLRAMLEGRVDLEHPDFAPRQPGQEGFGTEVKGAAEKRQSLILEMAAEMAQAAGNFEYAGRLWKKAAELAEKSSTGVIPALGAGFFEKFLNEKLGPQATGEPPDYLKRRPEDMDKDDKRFSATVFNSTQDLGRKVQTDILGGDVQKRQLAVQERTARAVEKLAEKPAAPAGAALLQFGQGQLG